MKKIVLTLLAVIFSAASLAGSVTFNEVLIKKQFNDSNFLGFTSYISMKLWCLKLGTAVDLGTFQAAQDLEKLEDGTYRCKGHFARVPYGPVKAFQVFSCSKLEVIEMQKECPTKP